MEKIFKGRLAAVAVSSQNDLKIQLWLIRWNRWVVGTFINTLNGSIKSPPPLFQFERKHDIAIYEENC